MAIMLKGTNHECVFIRFIRQGVVDAINIDTGETLHAQPLSSFKAGGGTNEIIREVKMLQEMKEQDHGHEKNSNRKH